MQIITNNHVRPLVAAYKLPGDVRWDEFDYITEEEIFDNRFFQYRGFWYDSHEFVATGEELKALGLDGIQADSVWSGIAVKFSDTKGHYIEDGIVVASLYWG